MRVYLQHDPYTPVRFTVNFTGDFYSMNVDVDGQNNWTDDFAVEFAAQLIKDEYDWDVLSNCLSAEVTGASLIERVA
ncbi:MAG: hypothetical protein ACO395_06975 [Pontimonas sp.]